MDSFWQAVNAHVWDQPEHRLEYRLYYDEQGLVINYSMEDLPGNFIVIDRTTFDQARHDVRIKDGKIVRLSHPASWKLVPAVTSAHTCHRDDITVIVSNEFANKQHWEVKTTHEAD